MNPAGEKARGSKDARDGMAEYTVEEMLEIAVMEALKTLAQAVDLAAPRDGDAKMQARWDARDTIMKAIEQAEPVPPVPEGEQEEMRLPVVRQGVCTHCMWVGTLPLLLCPRCQRYEVTPTPAGRPAEGTEDVEAEVEAIHTQAFNALEHGDKRYTAEFKAEARIAIVSLIQRQRAEAEDALASDLGAEGLLEDLRDLR